MKSIYLCGFMGAGKSTIGSELAKELGYQFYDLDVYIEEKEQMPISSIFASKGEPYFRKLESEALQEFAEKGNCVVATGGGALVNPSNASSIDDKGLIVYLQLSFEKCYKRIAGDKKRPLVINNSKEQLHDIYKTRVRTYENHAHVTFAADKSVLRCAKALSKILRPLV